MTRSSNYALILALVSVSVIAKLFSSYEIRYDPELPASIFSIEIGQSRAQLESTWTLHPVQNSVDGNVKYFRFEPNKDRDVTVEIRFDKNECVLQVVGEQLEQSGRAIVPALGSMKEPSRSLCSGKDCCSGADHGCHYLPNCGPHVLKR